MSTTDAGRHAGSGKPDSPNRDGVSLHAVIEAARRLDELSCARVVGHAAEAVHAAQKAGQPFGAVTPSAILLRPDGAVQLVPGPAARGYAAPERLRGGAGDRRSDVFALGVVLWEALAHDRLFDGATDDAVAQRVLAGAFHPPSELNANVPAELDAICKRALARDPADRYPSARVMAVEIDAVLGDAGYPDSNEQIAAYVAALLATPEVEPIRPTHPVSDTLVDAFVPPAATREPASKPPGTSLPARKPTPSPDARNPPNATLPMPVQAPRPLGQTALPGAPGSGRGDPVPSSTSSPGSQPVALGAPPARLVEQLEPPAASVLEPPLEPAWVVGPAVQPAASVVELPVKPPVRTGAPAKPAAKTEILGSLSSPPDRPPPAAAGSPTPGGAGSGFAVPQSYPIVSEAPAFVGPLAAPQSLAAPPASLSPARTAAGDRHPPPAPVKPSSHPHPPLKPSIANAETLPTPQLPAHLAVAPAPQLDMPPGITVPPSSPPAPLHSADHEPGGLAEDHRDPAAVVALHHGEKSGAKDSRTLLAGWEWTTGSLQAIDDDVDYAADVARASRRRLLIAIGGALGVVLVIAFVAFAFSGSKPSDQDATALPRSATPASSATAVPVEPAPTPTAEPLAAPPAQPTHPAAEPAEPAPNAATTPGPANSDPASADSTKTDPASADSAKTDSAKTDSAKTEPAKTEPAKTEPAKADSAKTEPARSDSAKVSSAAVAIEPATPGAAGKLAATPPPRSEAIAPSPARPRTEPAPQPAAASPTRPDPARVAAPEPTRAATTARPPEPATPERTKVAVARSSEPAKIAPPKPEPARRVEKKPEPRKIERAGKRPAPDRVAKATARSGPIDPYAAPVDKPKLDPAEAYRAGLQQYARGDTTGALATFRGSLSSNPGFAPTWRGLGMVYEKMGNKGQARSAFKRYLQLAPTAGDADQIRDRLERLGS